MQYFYFVLPLETTPLKNQSGSRKMMLNKHCPKAATGGVLKKVFFKISQNSQENTYASLLFNKVADYGTGVFLSNL